MKQLLIVIFIVGLALSGCTQQNTAPTPAQVEAIAPSALVTPTPTQAAASNVSHETPTPTPPTAESPAGLCSNPYYPVVDGATWVYDVEGQPQAAHTMSVEEEGKFKIAIVDADSAAVLEGRCSEEGILLLEQGTEGSFFSESGSSSTTTLSQEGVTLPNDLKVGDSWSQVTSIMAEGGDGEESLTASIITNYSVMGMETVTVPAGTFEALKIEQKGSMVMNGQEIKTLGYLWYAMGVGNVKTENGMADGERFLVQLVSYDIP
jgi:hypothetical protein